MSVLCLHLSLVDQQVMIPWVIWQTGSKEQKYCFFNATIAKTKIYFSKHLW